MRRWASKRDATHKEVAAAFESCGCKVLHLDAAIDMAVRDPQTGRQALVDAKTPRKQGGKNKNTDTQDYLVREGWVIHFVRSADEAVDLVIKWRRQASGWPTYGVDS